MKAQIVGPSKIIFIHGFLAIFKLKCDSIRVHKGDAMCAVPKSFFS